MSVRRLLVLSLLVTGLLAVPVPVSAGPRTDAALVRATNADRRCDARALWHNDISRATDHWVWLGQNVGCGSAGSNVAASVRRIQDAFMDSPGHRRNILYRRANLLGVGTHIKNGVVWVTVNFEQTTPGWR